MTQEHVESPRDKKTVLLALSQRLFRESIAETLTKSGLRVLGQANTVREVRHLAVQERPDIILLAGELEDSNLDVIERLHKDFDRTAIVVLRHPGDSEDLMAYMHAGAAGYLSANLSAEEFVNALLVIAEGDVVISREIAVRLTERSRSDSENRRTFDVLSEREREVLSLVAKGASNREIAESLIITENTVKVHLRNILDKLDLRNRQQAAAFAVQEGLVENVISEEPSK